MHLKENKLQVRVSCPLINAETRNRQFETIYLCLKGSDQVKGKETDVIENLSLYGGISYQIDFF